MKCPKCQYIGFESGDRCRNCGYEFSLAVEDEPLDLPIQTGAEPMGPMADLALGTQDAPDVAKSRPTPPPQGMRSRPATASQDLPLFRGRDDDAPLVTPSAVPRAPLSVRRAAPIAPRSKDRPDEREPALDLAPSEDQHTSHAPIRRTRAGDHAPDAAASAGEDERAGTTAPALPRITAAIIDVLFLGSINLAILYLTIRMARLGFADAHLLPPVPMAGFFLLIDGGYFVLFTTAGGQTIGKMLMRIRVVPADGDASAGGRVPLGHAIVRAAGLFVSILPAGLGYLPALVGQERRAIHDRLADTRVVKA